MVAAIRLAFILALFAAAVVASQEDAMTTAAAGEAENYYDGEDDTALMQDEDQNESMADLARKVRATGSVVGAGANGRYRAPPAIPRAQMNEFARELNRIKRKLVRIVSTLEPRYKRVEKRVKTLKKQTEANKLKVRELRKKIREHIRKMKKLLKAKHAKEIADLQARLKTFLKSREWLKVLKAKTSTLKGGKPGIAKYETVLADVKKSLADNADVAEDITGVDVVTELQDMETSRNMIDVESANDLELGSLKMYETARLHHIVKRMEKALASHIAGVKARLAAIHRVSVPRLHLGLRRALKNLKLVRNRYRRALRRFSRLRRNALPRVVAAKRELRKIARIERHIYASNKK